MTDVLIEAFPSSSTGRLETFISDWHWFEIGILALQSSSLLRQLRVANATNFI